MRVLLISTYDMGRQPFGLASPAAWLREAGVDVACVDLTREKLGDGQIAWAEIVAFFLPMHTATRLAIPVIDRVRATNARARLIAYGLYAPLNEELIREHGVDHVLGGEFEQALLDAALNGGVTPTSPIPRLQFRVPSREALPPLSGYATLQIAGERRTVGYTEASRGCKHRCRHCPIVPVYNGRFRVIPPEVVLADIRSQVAAGARHITFGDPDFFNGIRHAERIVAMFHGEFPDLTYDVTIKVEHLLQHAEVLPVLVETGCVFVTTAVESLDDAVLAKLEKGHTRADFERVVELCRNVGLSLAPTFVPFTPWTTVASYLELLHAIDRLELVEHVAPIQFAIRLLIPQGSRMLELEEVRAVTGEFAPHSLTYPWVHPDPAVDALQSELTKLIGVKLSLSRAELFAKVWDLAHGRTNAPVPRRQPVLVARSAIPYLNEPWYC
ncbi:MAG TPA: CUAEP/CCAEP-tail radical SAM protein [Vicinamibacterales bacterium]|nr:CUAEP/CCAEP-tail radical SAM protein [Vicinamibacterales bacterium]